MKMGFWNVGSPIPQWTHGERAEEAKALGYEGVVLTGTSLTPAMPRAECEDIIRTYTQAGVEVPMLLNPVTTHSDFDSDKADWNLLKAELTALARLAFDLGIPLISPNVALMVPKPGLKWDWTRYLDNLARTSIEAVRETPGVSVVFENHNGSASARQLLEMVERSDSDRIGLAFSPDHCIVMQEDPVELADRYAAGIRHVCFGDRRPVEEELGRFDGRYYYARYEACIVGEGITPVAEILRTLEHHGYDGYVSLKWEKNPEPRTWPVLPRGHGWHLPGGDVVLPRYIEFMRSLGVVASKA